MKLIDLTGKTFGKLTVISVNGRCRGQAAWLCRCTCGKAKIVAGHNLRAGNCKSCGCLVSELLKARNYKHGMRRLPEYACWFQMNQRCHNPKNGFFSRYGGRGITVCERWRKSFPNFISDMGRRPPGTTLDRKNNDGDYCPSNCRWATRLTQANNTSANKFISFDGQNKTLAQWADFIGIKTGTFWSRLNSGWTTERAIMQPLRGRR